MLTRSKLLVLTLAAVATASSACVLTTNDGSGGNGGFAETTSVTTSVTGTTTSTTGVTTATSTSTGTGACIGATGTGRAESECASANFPATCSASQMAPFAVDVCHQGFQIYQSGSWEELQTCFSNIPATTDDTCTDPTATDHVTTCLQQMYTDACANTVAAQQCDAVDANCTAASDPGFALADCKSDLNPFSTAGLNAYTDCVNAEIMAANGAAVCSTVHKTCFDQVTSIPTAD